MKKIKPKCILCNLEDGACICRHIPKKPYPEPDKNFTQESCSFPWWTYLDKDN